MVIMRIIQVLAPIINILPERTFDILAKAQSLLQKYAKIEVTGGNPV